jgi:hypothetical protein
MADQGPPLAECFWSLLLSGTVNAVRQKWCALGIANPHDRRVKG